MGSAGGLGEGCQGADDSGVVVLMPAAFRESEGSCGTMHMPRYLGTQESTVPLKSSRVRKALELPDLCGIPLFRFYRGTANMSRDCQVR